VVRLWRFAVGRAATDVDDRRLDDHVHRARVLVDDPRTAARQQSIFASRHALVLLGSDHSAVARVFIATFAFAIFVLREIREDPSHPFVPGLSTFAAISLVWLSLAMFVTYINHIGQRIRAVSVIETAAKETTRELRRLRELRPDPYPYDPPRSGDAKLVRVRNYGALGSVDGPALAKLAAEHDAVYEIVPHPGDFLRGDAPLVRVWVMGTIDEKHASAIARRSRSAVNARSERTSSSDSDSSWTSPLRRCRPESTIRRRRFKSSISFTNSCTMSRMSHFAPTSIGT